MKFIELPLHSQLQESIAAAEFTDCTPVQELTIQAVLQGRDVTVQSQTGTGKTAAFLIPLFERFLKEDEEGRAGSGPRALIVAPTRELAEQIKDEAVMLGSTLPFKAGAFYGGVGYKGQEQMIAAGLDIIIGTPGRLLDFERSKKLDFSQIKYLVVDEADRLFDMGFYPDLVSILRRMPSRKNRRTLLFSATMNTRVMNIAWEHMNEPQDIQIEPEHITVEKIDQSLYHVSREEKFPLLLGLLRSIEPKNALIFTNTKRGAEEVSKRLKINGYTCEFLMGDLAQNKRLKIIGSLKRGELQFLVATDVAARGLHVDDLELVVNYDIPEDPENYVHRIGRTARAGKTGRAISFADERFVYGLPAIEQLTSMKIPVAPVDESLFGEDKSKGMRIRYDRDDSIRARGGKPRSSERGGSRRRDSRPGKPAATRPEGIERKPKNPQRGPKPSQPKHKRRGPAPSANVGSPSKSASPEERLAYYQQKYGEDFTLKSGPAASRVGTSGKPGKPGKAAKGPKAGKATRRGKPGKTQQKPATAPKGQKPDTPKAAAKTRPGRVKQNPSRSDQNTPRNKESQSGKDTKGFVGFIKGLFGKS
ncbi:DEAD/DEAH box helicase [Spirochaeta lutea]|uniref:DEAD/DEAH box helicase n=1 Tax=Spirochaeta lutea TaxID=1480694 RepID=A0A098QYC1_9SPIO|nr:DEAD/DEAH box helicase [Spirochaeta lutea]KGE72423.1 hypothetical protein DC28_07115 [Spirochaeta lutea]